MFLTIWLFNTVNWHGKILIILFFFRMNEIWLWTDHLCRWMNQFWLQYMLLELSQIDRKSSINERRAVQLFLRIDWTAMQFSLHKSIPHRSWHWWVYFQIFIFKIRIGVFSLDRGGEKIHFLHLHSLPFFHTLIFNVTVTSSCTL